MNTEINLLQKKRSNAASYFLSKIVIIRLLSISILFVISLFSIMLFIFIAFSPLPSLQEREGDERKTLSEFHPKMARIVLTKERLRNVTTVLNKRIVYSEVLRSIEDILSDDAIINNFNLDSKKITIEISSLSLLPLEKLADDILTLNETKKYFSKITIFSLLLNPDKGRYELTMELLKV